MSPHICRTHRNCVGGLMQRTVNDSCGKLLISPVIFRSHVPTHLSHPSQLCWWADAAHCERQLWKVADFPYPVKKVCVTFGIIDTHSRREEGRAGHREPAISNSIVRATFDSCSSAGQHPGLKSCDAPDSLFSRSFAECPAGIACAWEN